MLKSRRTVVCFLLRRSRRSLLPEPFLSLYDACEQGSDVHLSDECEPKVGQDCNRSFTARIKGGAYNSGRTKPSQALSARHSFGIRHSVIPAFMRRTKRTFRLNVKATVQGRGSPSRRSDDRLPSGRGRGDPAPQV